MQERQKAFADRNPTIVSRRGGLELVVRMAAPAEIPEADYKGWALFPAEGAGSLALGLAAPPLFASALIVGGILLIPLGTYGYLHDKGIWDSISGALGDAEFTRAVDDALKGRLPAAPPGEGAPDMRMEIVVQSFGLLPSLSAGQYCLAVSAALIFSRGGTRLKEERLQIAESSKSEDAPPPQCASLGRFAQDGAELLRSRLAEYAAVLAVMAIGRIPREPPE